MDSAGLNGKASALLAALQIGPDIVPEGWFTAQQLAEAAGVGAQTVWRQIKRAGKQIECQTFRIQATNRIMPIPHYRASPTK